MGRQKWHPTKFAGVRFRYHETRMHGAVKRDMYFSIRFQANGERREEGCGWTSEGWTAAKAFEELCKLKTAAKLGEGPVRLAEKREAASVKRLARAEEKERAKRDALSFGEFWQETYMPLQQHKAEKTIRREEDFFKIWLGPAFADKALKSISPMETSRPSPPARRQVPFHGGLQADFLLTSY